MLRSFRENIRGRMGKVLLAIIIVPFVLFGAESLLTGGGGAAKVLDVNGEEIDALRLAQEVVLLRNEMASRMGENVDYEQLSDDRLTPLARQRLTQTTLIKQNFAQLGLATPDAMLQQTIMRTPEFQVDGKFSNERMTRVLADTGFNLNILKSKLAEDQRANQLRAGIGQSGFAITQNTELLLKIINESRKINWVALELAQVQGDLQISDSEIADYYDANSSEFYTELRVDAEYLLIDQQALQQPVESAAVLAEYKSQQAQFESSERRELAHILLEINQQQSEDQAREKARQVMQRHRDGASFAELAAEISQDPGTATEGGLLGYAEQDGSFPPAFEQAAFALQQGEVSEPVLTDAGIHLIKVTDIEKDEMPPFSELKPVIETQLAQRAARKVYVQQMERARDIAFNAADLQEPADALGLAVQRADSIAREGLHAGVNQAATAEHQHDGMVETIFSDSRVLAALFSEEVLKDRMNSELIELNDTQGVLVRVASTHEPRQLALSEVRNTIEAQLREVKAREKARALAVSLRD
ncbi:MAG: SurA N-terminal domain-containing protein, partial [Gammaproteobacteria bacterium]|nr:SurA N-terminal domain-containing protein [Gammaproteobacteria bacterium]